MRSLLTLIELWDLFGDIPIDRNDKIEQKFLSFPIGSDRFDIWAWFETQNPEFKILEHLI